MARSSSLDALEPFRFNVFVFNTGLDVASIAQTFTGFLRAGFTEVDMPRQVTTSIRYRENIDPVHPQKAPGITEYEPVVLRRGVTTNSDFFRWASQVHNSATVISTGIERDRGDAAEAPPAESQLFRRDILIVLYGREGANPSEDPTGQLQKLQGVAGAATSGFGLSAFGAHKAWILRNAFVSAYKPGDQLSAMDDSRKLVEELEITYESFDELSLETITSRALNTLVGVTG